MWLQMVATSLFALALSAGMMARGLPPIAYTIPARLAVLAGAGLDGHAAQAGIEGMAGLRAP